MNVLLIEDNPNFARSIERLLLSSASEIVMFQSVDTLEKGITRLTQNPVDVLLLDLTLPDSQGLSTLIRLQDTVAGTPVIVITGTSDEQLAIDAMRHGAQDYLVKSEVDRRGLNRAIRYAIERKNNEIQLRQQRQRQAALHEINLANASAVHLWSVLETLVEQVEATLPEIGIALWLHNEDSGKCEPFARWQMGVNEWHSSAAEQSPALIERIVKSCEPTVIDDLADCSMAYDARSVGENRYRSFLGSPLIVDGQALGVLGFFAKEPQKIKGEDAEFLTLIAGQAAIAIHKFQLFKRNRTQALHLDQANQTIRIAEHKYQDLINNINAIVWEADAATEKFVYVSREAEKLGFPIDRWRNNPAFWSDLIHPDDRVRVLGTFRSARDHGKDQEIEYRVQAADGRIVWLRNNFRVAGDERQQTCMLRGVMVDISRAKDAEAALQERSAEILSLQEVGQRVLDTQDVRGAVESILELAMKLLSCEMGAVRISAPKGGLSRVMMRGYRNREAIRLLQEPFQLSVTNGGENIFSRILASKRTHVFDNIESVPEFTALRCEGALSAIKVPILAQDEALGLLTIGTCQAASFSQDQVRLLETLASQIGIVIQKAALYEEVRGHLQRIETLRQFEQSMVSTLDLQDVVKLLLDKIESLFPVPAIVTVRLLDHAKSTLGVSLCRNFDSEKWRESHGGDMPIAQAGLARAVIEANAPVAIPHLENDPRVRNREFNRREGLISYLGVPLTVRDHPVGLMGIALQREYLFPSHEISYIASLAAHAAIAIQNANQYTELDKNTQDLSALFDVTSVVSHSLEMPRILNEVAQKIRAIFHFATTEVFLFDDLRTRLHRRTNFVAPPIVGGQVKSFEKGESIIGSVGASGDPVIIGDIETDPLYNQLTQTQECKSRGYRSLACFPIKNENEVLGAIICIGLHPRNLNTQEIQLITSMTREIAIAVDNTRRYERTREQKEQLRNLATHLEAVREQERTRIAREIHDELGQLLTALKLDFAWLRSKVSHDDQILNERFAAVSDTLDTTLRAVRNISTQLRPDVLDKVGLTAAIEWQLQEFRRRTGTRYYFTSNPQEIRIDDEQSTAIFRTLQEALTNVARHGHASQVKINLERKKSQISLRVEDNGIGIDMAKLHDSNSLGLLGMRERAAALGGYVRIRKNHKSGTTVLVCLPLDLQQGELQTRARRRAS